MKRDFPSPQYHRRGAIAVIAMITILITISIGLGLVKTALLEREATMRRQMQTQSRWLVEAGVERAIAQLATSAEYRGETWQLSADDLGGRTGGIVTIEIEENAESNDRQRVTVIADYPADSDHRIRSRKVITITNQIASAPIDP